jgi:hypothetical protein
LLLQRAGEGTRTLDIQLGKLALYQLSYARNLIELLIFWEPNGILAAAFPDTIHAEDRLIRFFEFAGFCPLSISLTAPILAGRMVEN